MTWLRLAQLLRHRQTNWSENFTTECLQYSAMNFTMRGSIRELNMNEHPDSKGLDANGSSSPTPRQQAWRRFKRNRLAVLAEDATTDRLAAAERACEIVRETWRAFEEFNLSPPLALEALFVRLRKELGAIPTLA